jgi:hypothetical protein
VLHLKCNQPQRAVEALEEMYLTRKYAFVEGLLTPACGSGCESEDERLLVAFRQSALFAGSNLARQMQRDRDLYWRRKGQLLERFRQLEPGRRPPAVVTVPGIIEGSPRRKALADVQLVDRPDGTRAAVQVRQGQQVTLLLAQTHVVPRPMGVIHDVRLGEQALKAGEIIFQLDMLDDGSQRYWKDGRVFTADLGTGIYCPFPGAGCAAEYLFVDAPAPEPVTWLKLRTSANVVGWSRQPERFE